MTPDEVRRLKAATKNRKGEIVSPGHVLVFVAGRKPLFGLQSLYFRDPEFRRRVAIPAPATHRIIRSRRPVRRGGVSLDALQPAIGAERVPAVVA